MSQVASPSILRRAWAGVRWLRQCCGNRGPTASRLLIVAGTVVGLTVCLRDGAAGRVEAEAKLDAAYNATLLGIPIGHINWKIEIRGERFSADASGETAGLLQVFSRGHGIAKSSGALSGALPVVSNFMVSVTHGNASDVIKILFKGGKAKEVLDHPPKPDPQAVPLTDASRIGVVDPMTGLLVSVPGKGATVTPAACEHTIPVFDGHMRYDLRFAYKRMEQVRTAGGYQGPVVVCAIYFTPLAGYDPGRTSIKYLQAERGMEIWLAPLSGTRLMAPFRVSVPTPIGVGVLQATRFIWIANTGVPTR